MSFEFLLLAVAYLLGFYMAWNIGANDVANAMASAVGAGAISYRQAVAIAAILNVVGATFIGSHVADTIRRGLVSTEIMADPKMVLIGAFSALLSASLWISFATWKSLPVSTTHSIVGAMIGFGIKAGGVSAVQWGKLGAIVLSWIISPAFSLIIAFVTLKIILATVLSRKNAFEQALKLSPFFIGVAFFVVVLSFLFKTPLGTGLGIGSYTALMLALILGGCGGAAGKFLLSRSFRFKASGQAEDIFRTIQIGTSCYVALSQGANDVANAVGPLAVIYFLVKTGSVGAQVPLPVFLLLFGGVGIAAGIGMAGHRVMETLGRKITTLSNTRGFSVDFAAATTVLIASKLGLPVSTTHAAVGGVLGVGLARGIEAVNFRIVFKIMLYWVLTVPAGALTSMLIITLFQLFF